VGQLAMAAVGLCPLVEQRQDLSHLLVEQPMHRMTTGCPVGQLTAGPAGDPAVRPHLTELQHLRRPAQRPARLQRLVEKVEQAGLGGRIDTARDPAT
jgi:hypothetical protein